MGRPGLGERVLGTRALNRALLDRQMLLRRVKIAPFDAIERLVGLQAQAPMSPYTGLWTRIADFDPRVLAQLITDRRVVRCVLMRSTIHLVTARDCLALRPLVAPVLARGLRGTYGARLTDLDPADVAAVARALVEERPRGFSELGALLAQRWPERDPEALANAARATLALVQLPPRGVWGSGGLAVHTTAEQWLGRPLATCPSLDDTLLRYLAAFGPATVNDMQTWSGLNRLRETVERLRPRLRTFRDERGHELFDVPGAPLPDPQTPAPPRFLADFDNLLLSHADRSRVFAAEDHKRIVMGNGLVRGLLVNGFVRGTWTIARARGTATLIVHVFKPLSKRDAAAVTAEGTRFLAFSASGASAREMTIQLA